VKAAIRPWGEDLEAALAALSGDYALILIGHGPLAYHAAAPAAEQAARVKSARERWGASFTFHLFSKDRELRWDGGVGTELALGADGDHDAAEREWLVAPEANALGTHVKVLELSKDGRAVDFKLEAVR
jgi:hypothetical protein